MRKQILILSGISLLVLISSCEKITDKNLLAELNELENVTATEIDPEIYYPRQFALDFTIPVDHNNPNGETYTHRVYLSHMDFDAPMVIVTSGYSGSSRHLSSMARILDANQIVMPHRGYSEAEIEPMDWEHLTVEQAAADNHMVIKALQKIYKEKWITTGHSKSGMTALFHKRHYPADVDATVAVAAPVMLGYPDTRISDFVWSYGGNEYQSAVANFQRTLLENRDSTLYYFQQEAIRRGLTFDDIGEEAVLEMTILEYPVYLLQYRDGNSYYYDIEGLSIKEAFNKLTHVNSISLYSDNYMFDSWLFYYQAFNELGYYDLNTEHVSDLLQYVDKDALMLQAPPGENLSLDETKMPDIYDWLKTEGDNIIYVYGSIDPYTAAAADPGSTNSIKIIQDNADHSFSLDDLDRKDDLITALENWLNININGKSGSFR